MTGGNSEFVTGGEPTGRRVTPHPWVWAALYFPYGLTFGFPAIALGYLGKQAGLPVSAIAGVVGMSFVAAGWKFLWAPLGDYTLSRKRWYLLATGLASLGLVALTVVPLSLRTVPLVSLLVLLTSISSTFLAFATEGLMVYNTTPSTRGRAAGWFQSGNQFGQTAGGGIGLWLMNHTREPWQAGAALAAILCLCATTLMLLEDPPRVMGGAGMHERARDAWENLVAVIRSRPGRIALLLAILPIGTGAAQFLFGSLAPEWRASADLASVVLGLGGGIAIVVGCFVGGLVSDRVNKPGAYAICCALGLVAAVAIAFSPRTPDGYAVSTLFYTFTLGMVAASFTALVLAIVGHSAAATTINLFFALSTLFSLGVLRLSGWAHDHWGTNGMLFTEAALGVGALLLFFGVARSIPGIARPVVT